MWPFGKLPVSQKVKIGLAYELKCPWRSHISKQKPVNECLETLIAQSGIKLNYLSPNKVKCAIQSNITVYIW